MWRAFLAIAFIALLGSGLSGCATKPAWQYYDECAAQNLPFAAMVECGKQKRTAYCQSGGACSADGNAVVAYADSLVQSVNRREMSEAEAQRKWIEFRMARADEQQRRLDAALAAADREFCASKDPACY